MDSIVSILDKAVSESVRLDQAFCDGTVSDAIDSLAADARKELDNAVSRDTGEIIPDGIARGKNNAEVL